jgi:hypothetical protein
MSMTIKTDAKQTAEPLRDAETPIDDAASSGSGRQPSPFTALKEQQAAQESPKETGVRNLDAESARRQFYVLLNRATPSSAMQTARSKR